MMTSMVEPALSESIHRPTMTHGLIRPEWSIYGPVLSGVQNRNTRVRDAKIATSRTGASAGPASIFYTRRFRGDKKTDTPIFPFQA